MKVLFASSEVWPLIKTGGLGDVAYSLPHALQQQGAEVRIVLPAYREVMQQLQATTVLGWVPPLYPGSPHALRIIETMHPRFEMPLWLVDSQALFDRPGDPYCRPDGLDWADNAERFASFAHAVAQLATGGLEGGWQPDVVHCNDWQTGLVAAFLKSSKTRPRCVFTIHNLAYGGHFSRDQFAALQLPWDWWSSDGVEFYGGFSMLKAGLVYADAITTVSPTYAEEICTADFGHGMEGVLRAQQHKLSGILNGIDTVVWNPENDPLLEHHYTANRLADGKRNNKAALLRAFGQRAGRDRLEAPLLGMVGRLVEQKGIDLILEVIPVLVEQTDASFVLIGSGDENYAGQLQSLAETWPGRVMVYIGYSEQLAHLLEAGSDLFLMPSRFEPCGLNQMYSMRYGTPPIVHATGGLADTVVDASPENMADSTASGFVFDEPSAEALLATIERALALYSDRRAWRKLQKQAMRQRFDWQLSARRYLDLYRVKGET